MKLLFLLIVAAAPADYPECEADPAVAARRVNELLAPLSDEGYSHGRERGAIEGLADLCQTHCEPVLAAALDRSRPPIHHTALWWALSDPPPRPYTDQEVRIPRDPAMQAQIDDAAQRTLLDPTETPETRRAAARALLHPVKGPGRTPTGSAQGEKTLNALLRESPDPYVRAAAACALVEVKGKLSPRLIDQDMKAVLEICSTPWSYGQQVTPPNPG